VGGLFLLWYGIDGLVYGANFLIGYYIYFVIFAGVGIFGGIIGYFVRKVGIAIFLLLGIMSIISIVLVSLKMVIWA